MAVTPFVPLSTVATTAVCAGNHGAPPLSLPHPLSSFVLSLFRTLSLRASLSRKRNSKPIRTTKQNQNRGKQNLLKQKDGNQTKRAPSIIITTVVTPLSYPHRSTKNRIVFAQINEEPIQINEEPNRGCEPPPYNHPSGFMFFRSGFFWVCVLQISSGFVFFWARLKARESEIERSLHRDLFFPEDPVMKRERARLSDEAILPQIHFLCILKLVIGLWVSHNGRRVGAGTYGEGRFLTIVELLNC